MVPRQIFETLISVFGSVVYFIGRKFKNVKIRLISVSLKQKKVLNIKDFFNQIVLCLV